MASRFANKSKTIDKDKGYKGRISFRGSGRDAAYRGAARSAMAGGATARAAHRAGLSASKQSASSGGSM